MHADQDAVKALKKLRLTADDFEVKGIIGRGHFGEVSHLLAYSMVFVVTDAFVYYTYNMLLCNY